MLYKKEEYPLPGYDFVNIKLTIIVYKNNRFHNIIKLMGELKSKYIEKIKINKKNIKRAKNIYIWRGEKNVAYCNVEV